MAAFIQNNFVGFSGFTRRGLYGIKQFYETYLSPEFILPLSTQLETYFNEKQRKFNCVCNAFALRTKKLYNQKVSALSKQLKNTYL